MTTVSIFRAGRSSVGLLLLCSLLTIQGCATKDPRDPFEPMNRAIYKLNEGLDKAVVKPVAQAYQTVLPQVVRTGVTNFFNNLYDVLVALNDLLQGKLPDAASDVGRVAVNTTAGIGGLIDVATKVGLEKHDEDFGQTLGRWHVEAGPYLQLPFFGPSSFRDGLGRFVDFKLDPVYWVWYHDVATRNSLWALNIVNTRANLLDATNLLEKAALDPYEFQRDAYLQRRRSLIYDGNPPPEKEHETPRSELEDDDQPQPVGQARARAAAPAEQAPAVPAPAVPATGATLAPASPAPAI
ncbi:MAG TPA: VacJ family lipoprotein [Burkholderiales bacterium]|nr:VacJ family lipoprotein [Burkholderiales bacterium]